MERTAKEKALAYNILKEVAFSILTDKKISNISSFQQLYFGREILDISKNKIEKIAKGDIVLTMDEAVKLEEALTHKIDEDEVFLIHDSGEPSENPPIPIPNLAAKKKIIQTVLNYFLEVHAIDKKENHSEPSYQIIEGINVTEDDIKKALALDEKYYKYENPSDEAFDIEKCMSWFKKNNHIYTMIKDRHTGGILGYINAVPVSESCYNEIRNGTYPDADIKPKDILDYSLPGNYNLYFASIVVEKEKNTNGFLTRILYEAFIDKLISLAKNGYIVTRILADAISEEGKKLCRGRMNKIKQTNHDFNSTIYEKVLIPSFKAASSKKERELYDLYYIHY